MNYDIKEKRKGKKERFCLLFLDNLNNIFISHYMLKPHPLGTVFRTRSLDGWGKEGRRKL